MFNSFFFLAGLLIGSFINVICYRLPKGQDIIRDRSKCPKCNKVIPLYLNIPIFSYLTLKGKSKCCKSKISIQYPIIELLLGIIFLVHSLIMIEIEHVIINCFISTILISIIIIDYFHKIIFDFMSYSLILFGLIFSLLPYNLNPYGVSFTECLFTVVISMSFFWLLRYVFFKIKKIEALGKGDIYLIGGLSAWIGFVDFVYLLSISSIIGILLFLVQKNKENYEIPFGSALGIGFFLITYLRLI